MNRRLPLCPNCKSGFKDKAFHRNGWFYAECGRRYNEMLGWSDYRPSECLLRQVHQIQEEMRRYKELATLVSDINPDHADACIDSLQDFARALIAGSDPIDYPK